MGKPQQDLEDVRIIAEALMRFGATLPRVQRLPMQQRRSEDQDRCRMTKPLRQSRQRALKVR